MVNAGTIIGTTNDGVLLSSGGSVNNQLGGSITGGYNGVEIHGTNASVVNAGTITANSHYGVYLANGGSVSNSASGTIVGQGVNAQGVYIGGSTGYVDNAGQIIGRNDGVIGAANVNNEAGGTISGLNYYGVDSYGGNVTNLSGGAIMGNRGGVNLYYSGSVVNAGSITGTNGDGVYLNSGGSVNNQAGGNITGGATGVRISGGAGAVYNAGTIIGKSGTAIQLGSFSGNIVTLEIGSQVTGNIVGGSNNDAAYLAGHGQYGTNFNGGNTYGFSGFSTLSVHATSTNWSDLADSWNLTGTNIFSKSASVDGGLLRVNGELDTPLVTLTNLCGLGGSGVINGDVDNQGYLSPGNSIGILTINGSLTSAGDYYAEVANTGTSDHIAVNGSATINGGNVIAEPQQPTFDAASGNAGIYAVQTKYDILTATNGVTGSGYSGATIDTNSPGYQSSQSSLFPLTGASLLYGANNVYLVVHRTPFTSVAQTHNQNAVAGALDGVGVTGLSPTMANLVNTFYWLPNASQARSALASLDGAIHGTLGVLDVQQQDDFNNAMAQRTGRISANGRSGEFASSWKPVQLASAGSWLPHMDQAEDQQPLDFWLQGVGSFGHLQGDGNALGGDYTIGGMSGGADYRLTPELLAGLGLGYTHDAAGVGGPGASGAVDAYQIGGYGGYVKGPWHLDGILSCGYLHTDTKRFINVGNISQQANGSYDGGVFSLSTEGGYAFKYDWLTAEPSVGLNYAHLWQNSFSETGSAGGNNYGLNVNSVDRDSVRLIAGLRLAAQLGRKGHVQFMPALHALWEHEFADRYADVNASFVAGSSTFDTHGVELGANSALLGGGLTVAFNRTVQGFVNYDASLNSQLNSSTVSGGVSISW